MKIIEKISDDQLLIETEVTFRFVKISPNDGEIAYITEKFVTNFYKEDESDHLGDMWVCEYYHKKSHLYEFMESEMGIKYVSVEKDFGSTYLELWKEGLLKYHINPLIRLDDHQYYNVLQYKRNKEIEKVLDNE